MSRINRVLTGTSIARLLSAFLLAAAMSTLAVQAEDQGSAPPPTPQHKTRKRLTPLVLPPLPAGPLTQVPMDQLPAAAPKVTYENGMLAITAQNATLGDILRDVHQLTGATIDAPPSSANERVVVQIGPGAPRDVLATLLNGTSLNYVMLGTVSDPMSVASVMLTAKASAGGEVQTAVNTAPASEPTPFQQMPHPPLPAFRNGPPVQPNGAQAAAADDDEDADSADDKDEDTDGPQPPQAQVMQPNQPDNPDGSQQPNGGPRTPEQLLQMIRDGQRPVPPGGQPPQPPPQQ